MPLSKEKGDNHWGRGPGQGVERPIRRKKEKATRWLLGKTDSEVGPSTDKEKAVRTKRVQEEGKLNHGKLVPPTEACSNFPSGTRKRKNLRPDKVGAQKNMKR